MCGWNEEMDGSGTATVLTDQRAANYLKKERMLITVVSGNSSQNEIDTSNRTAEAVMDGQAAAWGRVGFASQGMRCMEREEVAM